MYKRVNYFDAILKDAELFCSDFYLSKNIGVQASACPAKWQAEAHMPPHQVTL